MLDRYFECEAQVIEQLAKKRFGDVFLVLGEPHSRKIYHSPAQVHVALSPVLQVGIEGAVADWGALPLEVHSVETCLSYHATEIGFPRQTLLSNIEQVLAHDGCILLTQFNPWHWAARIALRRLADRPLGLQAFDKRRGKLSLLFTTRCSLEKASFVIEDVIKISQGGSVFSTWWEKCLVAIMPWRPLGYIIIAKKQTATATGEVSAWYEKALVPKVKKATVPSNCQSNSKEYHS